MKHEVVFLIGKGNKVDSVKVTGNFLGQKDFTDYMVDTYANNGFKFTINGVVFAELDLFPERIMAIGKSEFLDLITYGETKLDVFEWKEVMELYDFFKEDNFR